MPAFLQEDLLSLQQPALARVLLAVAAAVRAVSEYLRDGDKVSVSDTKSSNAFGDVQSNEDLRTDEIFKQHLRICSDVETVATEETPNCFHSGGSGFSVALDPLDGSSVMSANFAVGSIVGIWPGGELVGRTGREQAAACYAVYGPRTVLVVATAGGRVKEYALRRGEWERSRCDVRVAPEGTHVAPANARAAADNAPYRELLHTLLDEKATIRYSGALVADVHHALTAGQGLFVCPGSAVCPAKLRLLFEVAPLAFVVERAGGASLGVVRGGGATGGKSGAAAAPLSLTSALDVVVAHTELRCAVALGSSAQVARCHEAMRAGSA